MNSRFLSKAKQTFNGQWITGYYVHNDAGQDIIYDGNIDEFGNEHVEIDPSTLCQCTGLKDKNGKLIFEGDIVNDDNFKPSQFKIAFDSLEWLCLNPSLGYDYEHELIKHWKKTEFKIEIIGNIHDKEKS